jgi:hypothetical protein
MAQKDSRSRNWMGVVYHPNDVTHHPGMTDISFSAAFARLQTHPDFVKHCKYSIHGSELCPTTQTQHLQCFFVFKNDQSLANLRTKFTLWLGFNSTIAWKKADSNTEECINYCEKDGVDVVEFGSRPKGKGARSDLIAVGESIKSGCNMAELFDAHPASFLKFAPGMQKAIALVSKPRDWKTEVYWVHGPTGTGKSRWVMQTVDRSDLFVKDGNSKWFDGYAGQKSVLFDDFRPSKEVPFSLFLRLLDRYPMTVEGKGCSMNFSPERIFITTPLPPVETFQHLDWMKAEELAQLTRRITQVIHFPDLNTINQYALLAPFVMVLNEWGNSVGQQTRVKPVAAKTATKPSSTARRGLPALIPMVPLIPVLQPEVMSQTQTMTQLTDFSSQCSDMRSIHEQSGDSEPEDGESLHSEEQSQDSDESDDSFIVPDSVEETVPIVIRKQTQKKRSVPPVQLSSNKPINKKTKLPELPRETLKQHTEKMRQYQRNTYVVNDSSDSEDSDIDLC